MQLQNYPPPELYQDDFSRKDYELIILWTLSQNKTCTWSNFLSPPISIKQATLSNYLRRLLERGDIAKVKRSVYQITEQGLQRLIKIHQKRKNRKENIRIPPKIIRDKRNYHDMILWLLFNNESCRWSDFTSEPVRINQSSLSKNLNPLIEGGHVRKENGEYWITEKGKRLYEDIIKSYDLDNQSLLEEKTKLVRDLTDKTVQFFKKYHVDDDNLKYHFVTLKLLLNYTKVQSTLPNEEDFNKILLFLCLNHPDEYPNYISIEEFANEYSIEEQNLNHYIWNIVDQNLYDIKFFQLTMANNHHYYFHADEKIDIILSAIVDSYVTKYHFLNQLRSEYSPGSEVLNVNLPQLIEKIRDDVIGFIFHRDFKNAVERFLPNYLEFLAYKFEQSTFRGDTSNQLGDIYWQNIQKFLDEERTFTVESPEIQEIQSCENNYALKHQMYQILDLFLINATDFFFSQGIIEKWKGNLDSNVLKLIHSALDQEKFGELENLLMENSYSLSSFAINVIQFCRAMSENSFQIAKDQLNQLTSELTFENQFLKDFCDSLLLFHQNQLQPSFHALYRALDEVKKIQDDAALFILQIHEVQLFIHSHQKIQAKKKIKKLMKQNQVQPLVMRISVMISLTFSHKVLNISDSMMELLALQPDTNNMKLLEIILHGCLGKYRKGLELLNTRFGENVERDNPKLYRMILYIKTIFNFGLMDFEASNRLSRELENKFPNYSLAYLIRGIYYANRWLYSNQSPDTKQIIPSNSPNQPSRSKGLDAKRFGDYIEYAEEVEKLDLRLAVFNYISAQIYMHKQEYSTALMAISSAISYAPANYNYIMKKSYFLFENHQTEEALTFISSLIKNTDDYPSDFVLIRYKCLTWLKRTEEAIDYALSEIPKFSDGVRIKNHVTYGYLELKRVDEALQNAKEVVDAAPRQYDFLDSLAEVYYELKQYNRAIPLFLEIIQEDPNGWYVYESFIKLGLCYARLQDKEKSREYLTAGIELYSKLYKGSSIWVDLAKKELSNKETR